MFARFRRRLALTIAPELARLPHCKAPIASKRPQSPQAMIWARELRTLDQLYAAHTGVILLELNAPVYSGPTYSWRTPRSRIAPNVVMTLIRLRKDQVCGVHRATNFVARNYFASIWPKGLAWPADIKNPISEGEAS